MVKIKKITITLPEDLFKKAKKLAYPKGQTFSGLVRYVLESYIKSK